MENSAVHSFSIGKQITDFHIPGNGVIINGLPEIEKEPILSEEEILKSKIELLEAEIQKTREESYQEGFNACKRSLEEQNLKEINSQLKLFSEFKSNLDYEIKETLSKISDPILQISKNVASKVIEIELDSSQKWIESIKPKLEKFCNEFSEEISINVKIHSSCISYLQNEKLEMDLNENGVIHFVADDSLNPGECVIESEQHIVDASFQTQVNHIINSIS